MHIRHVSYALISCLMDTDKHVGKRPMENVPGGVQNVYCWLCCCCHANDIRHVLHTVWYYILSRGYRDHEERAGWGTKCEMSVDMCGSVFATGELCIGEKKTVPAYGGIEAYTQVVLSRLYSTPQHPERPNQRPINVEYFQALNPGRANQPRAFTSDSIQPLTP